MKKRIISILLVVLCCLALMVPAMAADNQLVYDQAELLTETQWIVLETKAESISNSYGCNVYLVTLDSIGGMERREAAKQIYLDNNFGYGEGKNGILFLVAMESRDYVTVTYGKNPMNSSEYGIGIKAFPDDGVLAIEDAIVPSLSDGDYFEAFETYYNQCDKYLNYYVDKGKPYVEKNMPVLILVTILVPLLIGLVVCLIFVARMKTAKKATEAGDYIPQDSLHITRQNDYYSHTDISRRKIEKNSGGSSVDSGGFGGSSGGKF